MAERTIYGKLQPVVPPPDQIEIQTKSYRDFLQPDVPPAKREPIGLQGIFKEIFPIESYDGHYVLEFVKYELSKGDPAHPQPKDDALAALREGVTYSASLNVTFRLKNGESYTEETVYMGEIPLMRENGSFVINGAERVIVSQLHRSPGICTERQIHANGTPLHSVRIIPDRGSWIEFQFDTNRQIWVIMDRRRKRRKFLASTFLRCLGYSTDREILRNFYVYEKISTRPPKDWPLHGCYVFSEDMRDAKTNAILAHRYDFVTSAALRQLALAGYREVEAINVFFDRGDLLYTLRADTTTNEEEALKDLYHKLRPGDPITASNASQLVKRLFFDPRRYDLGKVGRYKINQKLRDFIDPALGEEEVPLSLRVLDNTDFIKAIRLLACIHMADGMGKREREFRELYGKIRGKGAPASWKEFDARLRQGPGWCGIAAKREIDDIDHLGSRRIRTAGELLENQCRIGLSRTERVIHERMSLAASQNQEGESEQLRPTRLVNSKTFGSVVADFFARSQLSQFMDQTNPLSALAHKRRLSALGPGGLSRDRAGFEVRDVHPSHYGRICPIETPEGPNIGLISSLGIYAHLNEYGFIETPYRKVEHDRNGDPYVTDEIEWMSADREEMYVIAQANAPLKKEGGKLRFANPSIRVRYRAEFQEMPRERVEYMDVSPMQVISIAAGLIPFLEHDDANRALMGANMMRQAVPLLRTERPYVATGLEETAARDSRVIVVFDGLGEDGAPGVVAEVDACHVTVSADGAKPNSKTPKSQYRRYDLQKFRRTNAGTCFNQWPIVEKGQKVRKGDVLADGPATDQGELSLGKNLLVAYMPWCGYNFEDAILVSQRIVRDDVFTSVHILEFECTARTTKLGDEEITRDIPNVGEDALRNLDSRGVIRVGAEVKPGDILVGKVTPKSETELMPEEKLLRAIFGEKAAEVRDTSLKVQPGTYGIVMDVKINNPEDARPTQRRTASAATAAIDAGGSRRKPLTEADIRKRYEKGLKDLNTELTDTLSRKFLGEKIAADVVSAATGDVIVPANKKITKAVLVALARGRKDASAEPGPVADQLQEIFGAFEPKFAALDARRDAETAELEGGPEAAADVVRSVKVYLAEKKNLSVGDKLSGRHGNKGVVARILPDCDMPFLPNGQPMDIILNPMGVPSRMNLGQVFETHLGAACRALGRHAGTPVFDGIREESADKAADYTRKAREPYDETIRHMLHEAGLQKDFEWIKEDGKSVLFDGRTGEPFDQRVMVGVTYMLKLHHLVTDKIHARAVGPYSLVTQQPLGGKAQAGGQRMGEMEVWALEAYGVAYALQEMLTVKSDDVAGRTRIYESIVKGQNALNAGMPETFKVLISELKGLCLDMRLEKAEDALAPRRAANR